MGFWGCCFFCRCGGTAGSDSIETASVSAGLVGRGMLIAASSREAEVEGGGSFLPGYERAGISVVSTAIKRSFPLLEVLCLALRCLGESTES